jgi:Na+/glutamate symporter
MTDAMRTMLIGMVILMVPAFVVCVVVAVVAMRRRDSGADS